ncbi:MAG: hypothetical protein LQ346_002790 [Caloplaca aetnensis]|nr:MAG: hypothetical protein LQ346_002790 [Caloplaca aetnensis]
MAVAGRVKRMRLKSPTFELSVYYFRKSYKYSRHPDSYERANQEEVASFQQHQQAIEDLQTLLSCRIENGDLLPPQKLQEDHSAASGLWRQALLGLLAKTDEWIEEMDEIDYLYAKEEKRVI